MFASAPRCLAAVIVLSASSCADSRVQLPHLETGTYRLTYVMLPPSHGMYDVSPEGHLTIERNDGSLCEGDLTTAEQERLTEVVNVAALIARTDEDTSSCGTIDCGVSRICVTWMGDAPHCFLHTTRSDVPQINDVDLALGDALGRLIAEGACGPL